MSVLTSEAVVLRTWPVHEADLIVSFFTRDYGRMRGVAKAALKSRKRFGGALEPMTLTRAWFAERPRQELVRLDQLEILRSPLSAPVDQARMAVLSFYAEVIDEALPERDPQDAVFRLLASVLEYTDAAREPAHPDVSQGGFAQSLPAGPHALQPWMALTYFSLWMTRLMGLLP
ncbi:MAG TPA: DNA repair protein RecO, partial [Candidatus Sulfotelmatobacter sp.]